MWTLTDTAELHYEFCWKNKLKHVKNKMRVTMFSKTFGKLMWMALPNGLCTYYMQHPPSPNSHPLSQARMKAVVKDLFRSQRASQFFLAERVRNAWQNSD